jgi:hypothetical protein
VYECGKNISKFNLQGAQQEVFGEAFGEEYLTPAKDENELYAQCKGLNLNHVKRSSVRYIGDVGVCVSVCLSVCLSVRPFICSSVCLSVCPSVHLSLSV